MHSTKLFSFRGLVMSLLITTFTACDRDQSAPMDDNATDYTDQARLEQTFEDINGVEEDAANARTTQSTGTAQFLGPCATVTRDTVSIPHTITVDFGTANCLCNDGRNRRGQVLITYTGGFMEPGHTRTVTFQDFYVDDNQLTGTRQVTNMGPDANGNMVVSVEANGTLIFANGKGTATHSFKRTRTWIAGSATEDKSDDVCSITGSGSMTRANGKSATMSIIKPLIRSRDCKWIKEGIIKLTPSQGKERMIDFGNGECDDKAVVSVDGKTKEITLHQ
jgi:hypothetical protein